MGRPVRFGLAALTLVSGCSSVLGLGEYSVVADTVDAATNDAGPVPATNDATAVIDAPEAPRCPLTVPAGWSAAMRGAEDASCPAGFGPPQTALADPVAGAGACDCVAKDVVSPDCQTGNLDFTIGATCTGGSGVDIAVTNGNCITYSGSTVDHYRFTAPAPIGGSCRAEALAVPAKVSAERATLCAPPVGDACPPPGFDACIVHSGDEPCPPGAFTERRVMGTGVAIACSACTCSVTASCTQRTAEFFTDDKCMSSLVSAPAEVCNSYPTPGIELHGIRYTAVPATVATATGPKTATSVAITGEETICCAKK